MADLCVPYTVSSVVVNDDITTNDAILLTDWDGGSITGLDGAPIRAQIDPKGQTDGGIIHPKFFGPRTITFTGTVVVAESVGDPGGTAWLTAINTLESATISALEAILNTPTTLSWTPTGLTAHSISVTYGVSGGEVQFSGRMLDRKFTFTLVAADPTIAVA